MIEPVTAPTPVEGAFAEARRAQPAWAATPLRDRLKHIRRVRHLLAERCDSISARIGAPAGETLAAQVLPLAEACRFLESNAGAILARQRLGLTNRPLWLGGLKSEIIREPFGIVLIIAPANYSFFLPGVQLLQALVAGNAVLLKPGRNGGAAASVLRDVCRAAGIDGRLVSVLPATDAAAREAVDLPINKVVFTGSSAVGKRLLERLASRAIPAVLELSGCDPAIIRADANIPLAAAALAFGLRFNSGATCIAPRRVLVARRWREQLEAELVSRIRVNRTEEVDADLSNAILASVEAGAALLIGRFDLRGRLHLPCVLTDVTADMPVANLETFTPILSIIAIDSDEAAIEIANASGYGLGASVFTQDRARGRALASRLNAGVVTINDLIVPTADPRIPFGGRKESGYGVTRGAEGLLAMTQPKVLQIRSGTRRSHFDADLTNRIPALFLSFIQLLHGSRLKHRLLALGRLMFALRK